MTILKSIVNRLFIVLLALDQLICGVIWLRPDHTISGEVGFASLNNKTWALYTERVIDKLFGYGHCRSSIEWDEIDKQPFSLWK